MTFDDTIGVLNQSEISKNELFFIWKLYLSDIIFSLFYSDPITADNMSPLGSPVREITNK